MRSNVTRGGDRLTDEVVIDPDHIIQRGIGGAVELPENGYVLDLVVLYDTSMISKYGDEVEARVAGSMAHSQVLHLLRTNPAKMQYNILATEALDFQFLVADGLE